jgi:hypothetical protein
MAESRPRFAPAAPASRSKERAQGDHAQAYSDHRQMNCKVPIGLHSHFGHSILESSANRGAEIFQVCWEIGCLL